MTWGDVLNRAIDINREKQEIFINYSAHTNEISVYVFNGGWSNSKTRPDMHKAFYMEYSTPEDAMSFIEQYDKNENAEEHC